MKYNEFCFFRIIINIYGKCNGKPSNLNRHKNSPRYCFSCGNLFSIYFHSYGNARMVIQFMLINSTSEKKYKSIVGDWWHDLLIQQKKMRSQSSCRSVSPTLVGWRTTNTRSQYVSEIVFFFLRFKDDHVPLDCT